MAVTTTSTDNPILHQPILGARRFSNYWWATVVSMGATGFLLAGLSSYFKVNFLPFSDPTQLLFFPQGLTMGLYGSAGLLLALYLWLSIVWNIGGGYNEFNKPAGEINILRWGYPGKNRRIELNFPLEQVQSVRVEIKDGLNPSRALYLRAKGRRDILLTRIGEPLSLTELENQGAALARFLEVPLEGL